MAAKKTQSDNSSEGNNPKLDLNSRHGLKSLSSPQSLDEAIAEGTALLEKEAGKKPTMTSGGPVSKIQSTAANATTNPYKQARELILNEMQAARRNEILTREKNGKTDSRIYDEFIKEIIRRGDQLSN